MGDSRSTPFSGEDITALLRELQAGDGRALDRLTPLLYDELRRIARHKLRFERANHTLNTTALVHEAYLQLVKQEDTTWQSRVHFMAVASKVMRRILLTYAERRRAQKRGGGRQKVPLEDIHAVITDERADELIALDEALDRLAAFDEKGAQMVQYRFFGGLTQKEIGEVMGMSERTVRRHWVVAKSWIHREVQR